jgi:hypothetical protein
MANGIRNAEGLARPQPQQKKEKSITQRRKDAKVSGHADSQLRPFRFLFSFAALRASSFLI